TKASCAGPASRSTTGTRSSSRRRGSASPLAHFPITLTVMAGLVPAIHVLAAAKKTWMPGTRPGMTKERPTHPNRKNALADGYRALDLAQARDRYAPPILAADALS